MGRLRMQRSVRTPCFFKILMGNFTEKMRIPPAFVKNFHGKIIDESFLKCHNGKVWPVKVKQDVGHLFFHKGWQEFVKDNSLEAGEFLVFRYDGNLGFDVQIFGKSGCEKLGSLLQVKGRKCRKFASVCECKYILKSPVSGQKNGGKSLSKVARTKRMFNADNCPLKLTYPHFTARWRPRKPYTVPIPKAFATEHNLRNTQSTSFCDPSGKLWPVKIYHSAGRSDFGAGWRDFLTGNGVGDGDKCIFEFTQDNVIQVHVIRERK